MPTPALLLGATYAQGLCESPTRQRPSFLPPHQAEAKLSANWDCFKASLHRVLSLPLAYNLLWGALHCPRRPLAFTSMPGAFLCSCRQPRCAPAYHLCRSSSQGEGPAAALRDMNVANAYECSIRRNEGCLPALGRFCCSTA